jgi:hypothetical protein
LIVYEVCDILVLGNAADSLHVFFEFVRDFLMEGISAKREGSDQEMRVGFAM